MQPDPSAILARLSIAEPLVGFYDAPDPTPFEPLVTPGSSQCVFASLKARRQGKTLHLTREKHGCGGGHLFGIAGMSRQEMVEFLCDEEGLRADHELMNLWLDAGPCSSSCAAGETIPEAHCTLLFRMACSKPAEVRWSATSRGMV
jgi:hypothetical protein